VIKTIIDACFFFSLDSTEVKYFVEMMSIAAGEDDYEVGRVACFEACCQAFSPIIFDLNENSGFKEFEEACKRTASALKDDYKIIQKLVSYYLLYCSVRLYSELLLYLVILIKVLLLSALTSCISCYKF